MNMTAVYAHIFDSTMKEEIAKFQGKIIEIAGQVVDSNALEVEILEWNGLNAFKPKHSQMAHELHQAFLRAVLMQMHV